MNNLSRITHRAVAAAPRCGWHLTCLLLLLVLGDGAARAVTVDGLYDGTVRVQDRSEAARSAAFTAALGVVLTKVSGRSDAPARAGSALNNAARHVQRYSYLAGGLLEVGFDSAAVNALLEQAGLPLWERERPLTLVLYPQALQGLQEASMATEQTAKLRGVPIVWASSETSEHYSVAGLSQLQELARRYAVAAVLVARVGEGEISTADLRWQMVFNGGSQEMSGSAADGPNLAAEVLGRYYAATTKETIHLYMEVSGVEGLDAYARTVSYLNDLLMVRNVAVESLQHDVLRLRLELRGSQESLRRALAVDRTLAEVSAPEADTSPVAASGTTNTLAYRYRP
ncbi:MAG: DUF2066 domain-containing protein [Steroidobacteraceae bacterium]